MGQSLAQNREAAARSRGQGVADWSSRLGSIALASLLDGHQAHAPFEAHSDPVIHQQELP